MTKHPLGLRHLVSIHEFCAAYSSSASALRSLSLARMGCGGCSFNKNGHRWLFVDTWLVVCALFVSLCV